MIRRVLIAATLCAGGSQAATADRFCFDQAGSIYGVPPVLLRVIAQKESGFRPRAVNHNVDGSRDIGLMQINTGWIKVLAPYGIGESDLYEPCTNVHVGAWILATNFRTMGLNWQALGAYNARSPEKRWVYAADVLRRLRWARARRPG